MPTTTVKDVMTRAARERRMVIEAAEDALEDVGSLPSSKGTSGWTA